MIVFRGALSQFLPIPNLQLWEAFLLGLTFISPLSTSNTSFSQQQIPSMFVVKTDEAGKVGSLLTAEPR